MNKKMIRFPSIESFRHTIATVNRHAEFQGLDDEGVPIIDVNASRPTIKFTGTVKLHGTNAGVCWNGEELWAQSRGNIITPQSDNAGFAFFVDSNKDAFVRLMQAIKSEYNIADDHAIAIYGEWCGKGIQKGVAVNELDKMFVVFKVKIATPDEEEDNFWIDYDWGVLKTDDLPIRFIQEFPTYQITIDFNKPQESQNKLVELTTEVEKECPVGKAFGVSGIGEGVVWSGRDEKQTYIFKVKGEKHSVSKVKTVAPVDIEKMNNVNQFVEYAVTENRLEQGIQEVFTTQSREISKKGVADFLKWVQGDVIKEETDTLAGNGLEPKDVNKAISTKAVKWFMAKYGV